MQNLRKLAFNTFTLSIIFCFSTIFYPVLAQAVQLRQPRKTVDTKSQTVKWKSEQIEKWGVKSLAIPSELNKGDEMSEPHKNNDLTWTQYSRTWTKQLKKNASNLEADLSVTTRNTDFAKVLGLRSEIATPENILASENSGSRRRKNSDDESVEETSTLEIDGLKGNFFRAKFGENKNRIMVGWYTYRYFQSKAQRINVTVICPRNELQKAMKIIQSIKFQ